ncbi:MAG: tol-pal system protein YbgF [Deltaproteobacteria bacterium]|nr:tol-pal system protein YbgF [Deltaproteobacteria bacterium]
MRTLALGISMVALVGCGGGMKQVEQDLRSLRTRVDSLARSTSAIRNRMEDVENRVLLIQDEVETQKVVAMRGSSRPVAPLPLPTVKLTPVRDEPVRARAPEPDYDTGDFLTGEQKASDSVYQELDDTGRLVSNGRRVKPAKARPRMKVRNVQPPKKKRAARAEGPDPLRQYGKAYEIYKQGRSREAIVLFREFVVQYPRHAYADNAQYWVGECLYDLRDFEGAKREFMAVVTEHPDGNKVPDAMVKVGLCGKNMGLNEEARRMFNTVMLTYPDSEAAAVAMRLTGEMP